VNIGRPDAAFRLVNGVGIATSRVFDSLHHSPTEINTGGFIPSSRRRLCRHHRHLLRRCPRLALRLLPRLALVEGGYRKVPSGQKSLSRGVLDVFLLMSNGRPRSLWQRSDKGQRTERQAAQHLVCSGASAVGDFSHELPSITVPRRKTSVIFVPRSPAGILFPSDLKVLDTHDEFLRGWLFVDSTALVDRIDRLCYRNSSYLQMGSRNRKSQSPTCGA
jgi:hypothetical protein